MEILTRRAPSLSSFNPEARTVDAILATESPVTRRDYTRGSNFHEVLICTPAAIDASRMASLPILDGHRDSGVESRLGCVVPGSLRFETGKAIVTLQLSRNPKAELVFNDLVDGHTLNVSVGYRILKSERTAGEDGIDVVRCVLWEPIEISAVNVPADAGATTRSFSEETMPETIQNRAEADAKINEIGGNLGRRDIAESAIRDGLSVDEFRARLLDAMATESERNPTCGAIPAEPGHGRRSRADAAADALLTRVDASHRPADDAREFVGLSIPEIARRCVESTGFDTRGMSAGGIIARGLHSTSDFPEILSNLANKRLQAGFGQVSSALKRAARQSSAPNFKAKTVAKLSEAPELLKVNEHGEFKHGSMVESAESYRIETFGRIFSITRQALINDDLGAFTGAAARFGAAAGVHEAKKLVELLESNPTMNDGAALFHASHNNVATGPLSLEALAAARLLFRKQVGLSNDLVDLSPRFLVVPSELETEGEKLLAQIYAAKNEDVPAAARNLELVVEPRLTDAAAWYLVADPASAEGLEYSYLEGAQGIYIESRAGWSVDGVEIKARLDWGCAFLEHRSWVRSDGQVIEEET